MTYEQRHIFQKIINVVHHEEGTILFLYGYGGT